MPHPPDYKPPFGDTPPQSKEEMEAVHPRWIDKMKVVEGRYGPPKYQLAQCGGCSYYIPLEGSIGMDWGACSNPSSNFDGRVTFEHHGCDHHSHLHIYDGDEPDVDLSGRT